MLKWNITKPAFLLLMAATAVIIGWSWTVFNQSNQHQIETLKAVAKTLVRDQLMVREWVSDHGGVYVKKDANTSTGAYLEKVLGRSPDVLGADGTVYTLRNASLIFREIGQKAQQNTDIKFRQFGSTSITPESAPHDSFEELGLAKLRANRNLEIWTFSKNGNAEYFRYLYPFETKKSCLTCHEKQGHKEGEINGAISVVIPLSGALAKHDFGFLASVLSVTIFVLVIFVVASLLISKSYRDLAAAKQKAEENDEAKSLFLATMSHEIRTPLTTIFGIVDLISMSNPTPEKLKYFLGHIRNASENLLRIVNDGIDITKIVRGVMQLEATPFQVRHLVDEVMTNICARPRSAAVQIEHHVSHNCPETFLGDECRLQQILTNILGNSLKFTEQGHITLNVSCSPVHACTLSSNTPITSVQLQFVVRDSGSGIAPEVLPHIFEAFVTNGGSNHTNKKGTGLGLAIARKLAKLMAGDITCKSTVGVGSEFTIHVVLNLPPESSIKHSS
jgi:signal transduction histidine kinase